MQTENAEAQICEQQILITIVPNDSDESIGCAADQGFPSGEPPPLIERGQVWDTNDPDAEQQGKATAFRTSKHPSSGIFPERRFTVELIVPYAVKFTSPGEAFGDLWSVYDQPNQCLDDKHEGKIVALLTSAINNSENIFSSTERTRLLRMLFTGGPTHPFGPFTLGIPNGDPITDPSTLLDYIRNVERNHFNLYQNDKFSVKITATIAPPALSEACSTIH